MQRQRMMRVMHTSWKLNYDQLNPANGFRQALSGFHRTQRHLDKTVHPLL